MIEIMRRRLSYDEIERYALMWNEEAKRIYCKLFDEEMPILFLSPILDLAGANKGGEKICYSLWGEKRVVCLEFSDDVRCFVCHYTLLGLSTFHYHLLDDVFNFPYFLACITRLKEKLDFDLSVVSGIDWRFFSFVKPYSVQFHFTSVYWANEKERIEYSLAFDFVAFRWMCILQGIHCVDDPWQRKRLLDLKTQNLEDLRRFLPHLVFCAQSFFI